MLTFTQFHHSIGEFLFSSAWKPSDTEMGGGQVGAAIYIWGSILTCTLALVISVPFSLATAVFMTQIAPKLGERIIRPAVEIFVGIPSVVYGWVGLVVLVPPENIRPAARPVRTGSRHRALRHDLPDNYLGFRRCDPKRQ